MPDLRLAGCRSRPLLGYLKGLGVFRLVADQVERDVRVRWQGGTLELRSSLTADELKSFLLESYSPSPVLSPWNGRSGFYPQGNTTAVEALERIERDRDGRLAAYRDLISRTRTLLARLGIVAKPEGDSKDALIRTLRRSWPDRALEWLDAAVVLTGQRVAYPPLLGSGGNDGSYDFSSNFMQALPSVLHGQESESHLGGSLLDMSTRVDRVTLAHFNLDASPTNSPGPTTPSLGNPWDLVLAVEGTLLLVAGAARRHGTAATQGTLAAPFTARATAAGYGSAVGGEAGRAELWLPLWSGWASHAEIAALVRESRAQVSSGRARKHATTGLDFARSAGELGVARGIDAFERYAILERAGRSNLAVPVGRVEVASRPATAGLRSIDPWLSRLLQRSDRCPRAVQTAIRRLEGASFQLASRGDRRDACAVLEELGAAEHTLARAARSAADAGLRPLFGAPAATWIEAANDGSPEFAVAAAIASLSDGRRRSPALRDYLHGTRDAGASFDEERRHAVVGGGVAELLAAVHARRHLDAQRGSENGDHRGLAFDHGTWCDLNAARLFAAGALDDARVLRLLHGLAILDQRSHVPISSGSWDGGVAEPAFDMLALAWMGKSAQSGTNADRAELGPRPGWAARLAAGAPKPVLRDAMLRLRLAGMPPIAHAADLLAGTPSGPRLGAGLLVPLGPRDIDSLARKLTLQMEREPDNHQTEDIA